MTNYSRAYRALEILKKLQKASDLLSRASSELSELGQESMSDALDLMIADLSSERGSLEVIQAHWEENDK